MIDYLLPYNICIPMYCLWGYTINLFLKRQVYVSDILTVIIISIIFIKQFNIYISLSSGICTFILCFYRTRYSIWFRKVFDMPLK